MTERKKFYAVSAFEIKEKDESRRTFRGALSTSHLDSGNGAFRDIVQPGAFKRSLHNFKNARDGAYIPLVDSHRYDSIFNVYGHMTDGEEVLTGKTLRYNRKDGGTLEVPEMKLDTEWQIIDGPDGERLLDRLRVGSIRKMSMGYQNTAAPDFVDLKSEGKTRILKQVSLGEGSLVIFPMNNAADVDLSSVKSLLDALRDGTLTEDEEEAIRRWPRDIKDRFRALLAEEAKATPEPELITEEDESPEPDAQAKAEPVELAPDDPKRIEMEERVRDILLRSLATAA